MSDNSLEALEGELNALASAGTLSFASIVAHAPIAAAVLAVLPTLDDFPLHDARVDLIGKEDAQVLTVMAAGSWGAVGTIQCEIRFTPGPLASATFTTDPASALSIPGVSWLDLKGFDVRATRSSDATTRTGLVPTVMGAVTATMHLGNSSNVAVDIVLQPAATVGLELGLASTSVVLPKLSDIVSVVFNDQDVNLPEAVDKLTRIALDDLHVGFDPAAGTVGYIAIGVGSPDGSTWSILPDVFSLVQWRIDLRVDDPLRQRVLGGAITGTVALGRVELDVYAERPAAGGWVFGGGLATGQKIDAGALFDALGEKFGSPVPDALRHCSIETLALSFDTATKGASLKLGATFEIGDTPVTIDVEATYRRKDKGGYDADFAGTLAVGKVHFATNFVKVGTADRITFSWTGDHDTVLELADLCGVFGIQDVPDVPSELDLGLVAASVSYDFIDTSLVVAATSKTYGQAVLVNGRPGDGLPRVWYYGMNVGHPIDFGDLPLVKGLDASELSFGIDGLRVALASKALAATEASGVNRIILADPTRTGSPLVPAAGLPSRVGLAMVFHAGSQQVELGMPVASGNGLDPPPPLTGSSSGLPARPAPDGTIWFDVQKKVGPFSLQKVGVRYRDGALLLLVNPTLTAGTLQIGLIGLGVGTPLTDFKPKFSIDGLTVVLEVPPLTAGGGLVGTIDPVNFYGSLILGLPSIKVNALGGFAVADELASFFGYAVVEAPIGGPPSFFVTGLAAGLGIHRTLVVPDVGGIATFPLVQWATGSANPPATDFGGNVANQVNDVLARLLASGVVAPSPGNFWAAAGVRFTSYELVKSFVLLAMKFRTSVEVDLLGYATVAVPPAPAPPVAQAELLLKASISPETDLLSIAGQLTPKSYVLAQACRLSGGFAACWWFGGDHSGDFVITLGGYSPRFKLPAHYPVVPRLEMAWRVSDRLSVKGNLYFAVTSGAAMAGGYISAVWHSGGISAWFDVEADFLADYSPFHYYLSAGIHLGASFRIDLLFTTVRITIHLGVDLDLWGPEFSGRVKVDLSVISFTIHFGDGDENPPKPIEWSAFIGQLLPSSGPTPATTFGAGALEAGTPAIVQVIPSAGLRKTLSDEPGQLNWVVSGEHFVMTTQSAIPVKATSFTGLVALADDPLQPQRDGQMIPPSTAFGVGPTATSNDGFQSTLSVTLTRQDGRTTGEPASRFLAVRVLGNVPKGLWEVPPLDRHGVPAVDPLNATTIPDVVVGYRLVPFVPQPDHTLPVAIRELQYTTDPKVGLFEWSEPTWPTTDPFSNETVAGTITASLAAGNRAVLLEAMALLPTVQLDVADLASAGAVDLLAGPALRLLGEQKVGSS